MALFENYPYTNFHQLNLDWLIGVMKGLVAEWESISGNVTADAHTSLSPTVTVTGDLKNGLNFSFGLVRGQQGPQGPEGPQGQGLEILDVLSDPSDLPATGSVGDVYEVLDGGAYHLYVWSETDQQWVDIGSLGTVSPSSSTPLMDGTGAAGTSTDYARADHVHPSDNNKQDLLVSGTDIQTINGNSILTSGDLLLQTPLTASSDNPLMDGTAAPGTSLAYSRKDHVHPSDTSKVNSSDLKTINSTSLIGAGNLTLQTPLAAGTDYVAPSSVSTINGNSLLSGTNVQLPTIYYGTSAPGSGIGVDGDIYVEYSI